MLLWRASFGRVALGRAVWRAAFVHVGSAYWHYMIRGVLLSRGDFWEYVVGRRGGGFPPTRE